MTEESQSNSDNDISLEEFVAWKRLPITKKIYHHMSAVRGAFSESLNNGETLYGGQKTVEETARVVGILRGIDLFLEAEYGDQDNEEKS
jgi:hypothetical protein